MTNDNSRKCDECGVKLNGVDDASLLCYDGFRGLCYDCAEHLDYEREMDNALDRDETDGDAFDDRLDMYMNEY